ncbi:hypothetical protein BX616_005435 [Lobosporangium transversale]|nr:hypothetical protein BX616_005435 [Lobosporangium transversale]
MLHPIIYTEYVYRGRGRRGSPEPWPQDLIRSYSSHSPKVSRLLKNFTMRFSVVAAIAALASIASAQSAYFPFAPQGPCVSQCTNSVGKTFFANYNDIDEYNQYFIISLSYTFERGTPTTRDFMTKAGICMSSCPQNELDLYTADYSPKLEWYKANKNLPIPPRP